MKKSKIIGAVLAGITTTVGVASIVKFKLFSKENKSQDNSKITRLNSYYTILSQWMTNKLEDKKSSEYLEKQNIKTVAIYGMGNLGELLYQELKPSDIEVKYFVDKNAEKLYYGIDELPIVSVEKLNDVDGVDAIIVTPTFAYDSIEENIKSVLADCKILSLEDIVFDM
ncbi:hypothetical protein KQI69_00080 [Eubacterium sp. MSJ-13]|uniref:hypothetical protein n=1 Tax=Eubacterium sp. MSJ-13 TaxID=2841513 RepID=UPI001C0F4E17|nr:hypothetical protein [Eubacterium sp. MSJ-13]MBU5477601.1 hypothetical protein [Eubacterium sp. MSJ-13]